MNDEHTQHARRDRLTLPPRQSEPPSAGLGAVARDVVDHAQIIARDAFGIGKLEARRALERTKERAREVAPRIAFGAIAAVAAVASAVFLLIAIFLALGDPIPSVGWRMAIFGVFFLVVAVTAGLFASTREKLREERPQRVIAEVAPPSAEDAPVLPPRPH
jgi:hypothetical protein